MSDYYPGQKFSLPETGSGAVAPIWRRFLAVTLDWSLAVLASFAFFNYDGFVLLLIFFGQRVVLQALIGMSFGQLIFGIRLARVDGKAIGIFAPIIRTALLCLAIPAIIMDPDQRGIHDLAAKTIMLKR